MSLSAIIGTNLAKPVLHNAQEQMNMEIARATFAQTETLYLRIMTDYSAIVECSPQQ